MSITDGTRVAVIGAGGIGKHHAKWWALEGADVCAFAGTSEESVVAADKGLKELFPFKGEGYTDVEEMLEKERPDIVDVCSPPACHYHHARQALEAGCHVLCEKPFVYRAGASREGLMAEARELALLAESRQRRLGLCVQYAEGARMFRQIWAAHSGGEAIRTYRGHLESPAKGRSADPERVWVDLAPHPLSVLQALFSDGQIEESSLTTNFNGYDALASFRVQSREETIECEVITRNSVEPPRNVREFALNGYALRVEGGKDEQGIYCARIETPDGAHFEPDMMRLTIRRFLEGQPSVDGAGAVQNNEWLLRILASARSAS